MAIVAVPPNGLGTGPREGGGGRCRRRGVDDSGGRGGHDAGKHIGSSGRRVATHRDGLGHRGRCAGGRREDGTRGGHRVGAAVADDGELGRLRVDHVDVGAVDGVAEKVRDGRSAFFVFVAGLRL